MDKNTQIFNCLHSKALYNNYLSQIYWYYEFSLVKTVEERYSVFLHFITKAIQQYVPYKTVSTNKRKLQLPNNIKKLLSKKKNCWRTLKNNNTPDNKRIFNILCRNCKKATHRAQSIENRFLKGLKGLHN